MHVNNQTHQKVPYLEATVLKAISNMFWDMSNPTQTEAELLLESWELPVSDISYLLQDRTYI